jgi:hypothetical protein
MNYTRSLTQWSFARRKFDVCIRNENWTIYAGKRRADK